MLGMEGGDHPRRRTTMAMPVRLLTCLTLVVASVYQVQWRHLTSKSLSLVIGKLRNRGNLQQLCSLEHVATSPRLISKAMLLLFLESCLSPKSIGAALSLQRPVPGTRPLYLHVHIPKTGGTSLKHDLPELLGLQSCNTIFKIPSCCNKTAIQSFQRFLKGHCNLSCDFLTYETNYQYFADMFRNCKNRELRFITSVRDPYIWRMSQILHGVRKGRHSVAEKINGTTHAGYDLKSPIYARLAARGDTSFKNAISRFYFIILLERYEEGLCTIQAKAWGVQSDEKRDCQKRSWEKRNVVRGQAFDSAFTTAELMKLRSLVRDDEVLFYSYVVRAYEEDVQKYVGSGKGSILDLHFAS